MLQDDQTLADEISSMADEHFRKLASLAIRTQGAKELGAVVARSSVGDNFLPDPIVIEKMASQWAEKTASYLKPGLIGASIGGAGGGGIGYLTSNDDDMVAKVKSRGPDKDKTSSMDLEKLGMLTCNLLGDEHMEKLAAGVMSGEIDYDELTDMEKVAIGWLTKGFSAIGKGLKGAGNFLSKGKTVKMPTPGGTTQGPGKFRQTWDAMTGKGKSVADTGPVMPKSTRGFKGRQGGQGPYRSPGTGQMPKTQVQQPPVGQGAASKQAPVRPTSQQRPPGTGSPAPANKNQFFTPEGAQKKMDLTQRKLNKGPRQPFMDWKTKAQIGAVGGLMGATYLGGKALDTANTFLTPQPPGTAYQYGGSGPSHFRNPQMGM